MATTKTPAWVAVLKQSLKDAGVPRGWSVSHHRGSVRLRIRKAQADGSMASWNRTLPITWEIGCIGPVTEAVSSFHREFMAAQPASLSEVWARLNPEEPKPASPELAPITSKTMGLNWKAVAKAFYRDRQQNGKRVSDKTIALEQTYCDEAVALLSGTTPPTTAYKLIDQTIQAGGWGDKPRARQQCVGAINRLLTFAVSHEGLAMDWILPQHQKLTLAGNGKPLEGKKEIATLSDLQILQLLDSVPTQEWRNLLLVMAVYGLRPEEVMHLTPKKNPTTGKLQLWCSYCKAAGGRSTKTETKPRWLQAIPLHGPDGAVPQNDLAQALEGGLFPFPPLGERGAAIAQYLGRLKLWKQWKAEFEERGLWLRPYSFRNTYSERGHLLGIPGASMAMAMGHSELTHSTHYVTAKPESTSELFERMLGQD